MTESWSSTKLTNRIMKLPTSSVPPGTFSLGSLHAAPVPLSCPGFPPFYHQPSNQAHPCISGLDCATIFTTHQHSLTQFPSPPKGTVSPVGGTGSCWWAQGTVCWNRSHPLSRLECLGSCRKGTRDAWLHSDSCVFHSFLDWTQSSFSLGTRADSPHPRHPRAAAAARGDSAQGQITAKAQPQKGLRNTQLLSTNVSVWHGTKSWPWHPPA